MVIESLFIYHFVDPDLMVETRFEDGVAENRGVGFEIEDIDTSFNGG